MYYVIVHPGYRVPDRRCRLPVCTGCDPVDSSPDRYRLEVSLIRPDLTGGRKKFFATGKSCRKIKLGTKKSHRKKTAYTGNRTRKKPGR